MEKGICMKKLLIVVLLGLLCALPLSSKAYLSVNDLDPQKLSSTKTFDDVSICATSEKGVSIDLIDVARTAKDGEIFNSRIKLGGTGSTAYRSLKFTAKKGEKLTIYLNSSSKTDARTLAIAKQDGTEVATIVADPDTGTVAGMGTYVFIEDGVYYVYSKNSGIYIYEIVVEK